MRSPENPLRIVRREAEREGRRGGDAVRDMLTESTVREKLFRKEKDGRRSSDRSIFRKSEIKLKPHKKGEGESWLYKEIDALPEKNAQEIHEVVRGEDTFLEKLELYQKCKKDFQEINKEAKADVYIAMADLEELQEYFGSIKGQAAVIERRIQAFPSLSLEDARGNTQELIIIKNLKIDAKNKLIDIEKMLSALKSTQAGKEYLEMRREELKEKVA